MNSHSRNILHFFETLYGGPATYLNELLSFQVASNDKIIVACPENQSHLIEVEGVEVIYLDYPGRSLANLIKLMLQWRKLVRKRRFDIVHLHSTFAGFIGRIIKPKSRIVYCPHGWSFTMEIPKWKRNLYAFIERTLGTRTDAIINVSENDQMLAEAERIAAGKCHMVHNGMRDDDWEPLPPGKGLVNLLFIGRYDRQKGFDLLVQAMEVLARHGFKLISIGKSVVNYPVDYNLQDSIEDRGWQTPAQVRTTIRQVDAIIMPSRWEGLPLVAIEAMRAGRPVLGSKVGGLPEVISDNETGLIFESNSVNAIISACLRLQRMDIRLLGLKGRERYEAKFTARRMAKQIDEVYHSMNKPETKAG